VQKVKKMGFDAVIGYNIFEIKLNKEKYYKKLK